MAEYSVKLLPIKRLTIFKTDYVPTKPDFKEIELKTKCVLAMI